MYRYIDLYGLYVIDNRRTFMNTLISFFNLVGVYTPLIWRAVIVESTAPENKKVTSYFKKAFYILLKDFENKLVVVLLYLRFIAVDFKDIAIICHQWCHPFLNQGNIDRFSHFIR